jgi:hypothetical protein
MTDTPLNPSPENYGVPPPPDHSQLPPPPDYSQLPPPPPSDSDFPRRRRRGYRGTSPWVTLSFFCVVLGAFTMGWGSILGALSGVKAFIDGAGRVGAITAICLNLLVIWAGFSWTLGHH